MNDFRKFLEKSVLFAVSQLVFFLTKGCLFRVNTCSGIEITKVCGVTSLFNLRDFVVL